MKDEDLKRNLQVLGLEEPKAPVYLAPRILQRLTEPSPLDTVIRWITAPLWRGALAAFLPLVVGFAWGIAGASNPLETDTFLYETHGLVYADTLEVYEYDEF